MQRSLRDIAALYNCEASLEKVEEFRTAEGLTLIGSKCFQAANISAILIDDGITFDKMLDLDSHKAFSPVIGRVLRIERLAETIINEVSVFLLSFSRECITFLFLFATCLLLNGKCYLEGIYFFNKIGQSFTIELVDLNDILILELSDPDKIPLFFNEQCLVKLHNYHFQESFSGSSWTLDSFTESYVAKLKSYPPDFPIPFSDQLD